MISLYVLYNGVADKNSNLRLSTLVTNFFSSDAIRLRLLSSVKRILCTSSIIISLLLKTCFNFATLFSLF